MNQRTLNEIMRISEKFFRTHNDPSQIQVGMDSYSKLQSIHSETLQVSLDNMGRVMGWTLSIPTNAALMRSFLDGTVTESQLLMQASPDDQIEAVYLAAAFVLPKHRRKGLASRLFTQSLARISGERKNIQLYCWPFTKAGHRLAQKIARLGGFPLHVKG